MASERHHAQLDDQHPAGNELDPDEPMTPLWLPLLGLGLLLLAILLFVATRPDEASIAEHGAERAAAEPNDVALAQPSRMPRPAASLLLPRKVAPPH
jgi:hypothetical protein